MKALAWINLGLAFVLELAALYFLGIWGFQLDIPEMGKWYFALITPFVFICAWSFWAAPQAAFRLKGWKLFAFKWAAFSLAAWALWATGQTQWATLFEMVVLVNLVFSLFLRPDPIV